jgi:hypothetical protein
LFDRGNTDVADVALHGEDVKRRDPAFQGYPRITYLYPLSKDRPVDEFPCARISASPVSGSG